MSLRSSLLLLVLLGVLTDARVASAQLTAPTVRNSTTPSYPEAAETAGVSGDATVRVTVDPGGRALNVEVLSVPRPGFGFEESLLQAVRSWEFSPATRDGVPARGVVTVLVPFRLTVPGDFLFDVSPERAWSEVRALIKALKLRTRRLDEKNQLLVTRETRYDTGRMPRVDELGLVRGANLSDLSWTVGVSPLFRNARVSISSEVDLQNGQRRYRLYRNQLLASWFAAELGRRLGMAPVPLPDSVVERARLSAALPAPSGRVCEPTAVDGTGYPGLVMPRPSIEVKPVFPLDELQAAHQGYVLVRGTLTEHGTLRRVSVVEPPTGSEAFKTNASSAAAMWRFAPALVDGCPVEVPITIGMTFRIR